MSQSQNPLLKKTLSYIRDWEEWLECWKNETRLGALHSLLYNALDAGSESGNEDHRRILFLLEVADGHDRSRDLQTEDEGHEHCARILTEVGWAHSGSGGLRALVAQKAMQVLCLRFFRPLEKYPGSRTTKHVWIEMMLRHPELFDKLIWFLRREEKGSGFYNEPCDPGNIKSIFRDFARDFCHFVWLHPGLYDYRGFEHEAARERLEKTRPQIVGILATLGALDNLLNWKDSDDPVILGELEKLVFSRELYLPSISEPNREELRIPQDLDEAVMGHSAAAEVLKLLKTASQVKDHFRRVAELRRQATEAQERLAEAQGGK